MTPFEALADKGVKVALERNHEAGLAPPTVARSDTPWADAFSSA